jgi:hypothetical protein
MEKTFTVKLTESEGSTLLNLIDIAVKAGGLSVAKPAVDLAEKLKTAFDASLSS